MYTNIQSKISVRQCDEGVDKTTGDALEKATVQLQPPIINHLLQTNLSRILVAVFLAFI